MKTSGAKKIQSFLKAYYKPILFFTGLTLLNVFFLCSNFKTNSLHFGTTFIVLLISSILIEAILCILLIIAKRKSWKMEKLFFVLGLIIGIFYLVAIPVGRVPDEESHFFRVYEIASGHLSSDVSDEGGVGSLEPGDIEVVRDISKHNTTYYDLLGTLGDQADEEEKFINTSADGYNIISYFPQVTGMFIGRSLGLPYLVCAYLAKFFNLLFCLLILYFSIKYIPFLKEVIFFIAMLPISMQSFVGLSTDALIMSASIALISFVLYSTYSLKTTFKKKHLLVLLALCILVSITKIVYAPLCLLLFAIPKERFGGLKRKIAWILALGIITIMVYLAWRFMAPPIRNASDPGLQLSSILSNPAYYIAILINSISDNAILYFVGTFGGHLEWFNVNLSMIYIFTSFTVFVLLCVQARKYNTISKAIKYTSIALFILITVAIFTALYISWTKVGETVIDGVQGRYLLPLILLIPIMCLSVIKSNKKELQTKPARITKQKTINYYHQNYYLYAFFIFESIYAVMAIICTHI